MRDGLPEQQPVLRSCVVSLLKSSSNARNAEAHARSGTAMQFADARQQWTHVQVGAILHPFVASAALA
jgi:hypothetical protein